MIKVLDNQSGEPIELTDDSQLPELVERGAVSIPDREYEFQDELGKKFAVPAKSFLDAIKSGWRYRSEATKEDEKLEEKYGNSEGSALALALARGATFGLSDVALEKTGLVSEEALREIKNRNPGSSLAGDVIGTVGPALLTGGSSLAAKAVAKTPMGLVTSLATRAGSRAAQNIPSKLVKSVVQLGTEGIVDGAATGLTQAVSEAELGNAEFNAETLLANVGTGALFGAGFGATVGAGAHYINKVSRGASRQIKEKLIQQVDGDDAYKAQIRKRLDDVDAMEDGILALKDPEIQRIKQEYPDAPITEGMESSLRPIKQVEDYLYDAPTAQGEAIRRKAEEIEAYVQKNVDEIWSGAREASPEETGDLIRQTFFAKINEPWESGKAYYNDLMSEFGGMPVSASKRAQLSKLIKGSDAYRIGAEGADIKRIMGILDDGQDLTLRQIKELQGDVGASIKTTKGSERKLLRDTYDKLRKMQDSIIRESVGDSKAAKKILEGLDAANADYGRAYDAKDEIAELFGIKGADFDTVLEKLENMSAVKLDEKFLKIKESDKAFEILKKYPEIGKLVLANRQSQLLKKHITQNGVSYAGIKKDLMKMSPQERAIYFGGDKVKEKRFLDMLKIHEKRPKTMNPSGTDVRREFRDFLSPKTITENWILGEIHKGDKSLIGRTVNKIIPVLSGVEKSANKTKNNIASSVNAFFKATPVGVAAASLESLSDREIKRAEKNYDLVQSSPESLLESFTAKNRDLIEAAPETANALQQRIIAGIQFLQSKHPKRDQTYIGEDLQPSRSELIRFHDYMEAVENPKVVFDQLKQGHMNSASIEVLRTVYPQVYASLQAEVIAKMPKHLTRRQKIQLQPLLGSKVTPAMDYNNLMRLQGKTAQGASGEAQAVQEINRVPGGLAQKMKTAERAQTGLAKTINRP
jgi:hypothetical protein